MKEKRAKEDIKSVSIGKNRDSSHLYECKEQYLSTISCQKETSHQLQKMYLALIYSTYISPDKLIINQAKFLKQTTLRIGLVLFERDPPCLSVDFGYWCPFVKA